MKYSCGYSARTWGEMTSLTKKLLVSGKGNSFEKEI